MKKEIYIMVDTETSGPIPDIYSLLSIGAAVVGDEADVFYEELVPLNDNYVEESMKNAGDLTLAKLKNTGIEPAKAMAYFEKWIESAACGKKPVFVGFNAPFDWMFICYYFIKYLGRNPFGHNALDAKAYYMGMMNTSWKKTSKNNIDPHFTKDIKLKYVFFDPALSHNALVDTQIQAKIFERMLAFQNKIKRP